MADSGNVDTDILSDEIFDVLCSMCKNQGKNAEGVKYCVDCKDYFCVNCVKVHSQVPVLVGHKVLDKSQVKSGTSKGLPRAPTERCDRHSHKHIDMYCQNHDNVGCSTCMAVDHRLCKDTFYIPEFIQNNTYQVISRGLQTKLNEIAKTLAKQADIFKQDKQRLLKRKAELLADIRKFRQEINDKLDKLEKSSIEEMESKVKSLEDKIEDGHKQLQAYKSRVTSANDKLASKNTNQAEVFVYVKMAEDAANVANNYMKHAKMKSTVEDIEFLPDSTILTQLDQMKTLCTLTEKHTKKSVNLFHSKGNKSYNVKVESDNRICNITSVCCMEDGTIILGDGNNRKLIRLHSYNYTVTDFCDLPGFTHQVCMINNTQVAITVPSNKEVHFISLSGKMKTTNKIKTDFECYCFAYANNNLYISDFATLLYMYTLSGRKLKQYNYEKSEDNLFYDIHSIAVSQDATRIYVADFYKGLIVLDHNGHVITSFNGEQLKGASCCYLTEAGSVLVSGQNSNNVLQFTCDGELIGEVIKAKSGKQNITSVSCNQRMTKMCISRQGSDNIEVYDI
ncbi:uncharacterized protein LOC132725043 isoform X1 [Ruditapes philippinarum]|uniref:uncharacterized protein LOC132725043 isoform X1 n=1 Tax=Ruditapes philippinarum TaxID=129788 RepID=UPI00295A6496|nr:uncharacterized protein LOC132725043 isoform X1 [Ruditapes philippinarum]